MTKKAFLALSLLTGVLLTGSPALAQRTTPAPVRQTAPEQQNSSNAILTAKDLPSGFQAVPEEVRSQVVSQMVVVLRQQLPGAQLKPENLFGFFNPESSEVLMGYTETLANQSSQAQFDNTLKQIQQPEMQKKLMGQLQEKVKNFKEYKVEVLDYRTLSETTNIANSSAGVTLSLKIQDQPVRVDIVSFRRNGTVALAAVANLNGQQPVVNLSNVARTLDSRISQSSPAVNRSQF